jgi:hypothetical protein
MSLAMAVPAGASTNAAELTSSGSNTTYSMMVQLGDLFNTAPGCDLTASGASYKQMNCGTSPIAPGTPSTTAGENGVFQTFENPYNDFEVNAPAVGSGSGVNQLNDATPGDFIPSFARSSGAPSASNGTANQNYVAYAMDGVDWSTFNGYTVGSSKTVHALPSSYVSYITNAEVKAIWAGTLGITNGVESCTLGSGSHLVHLAPMTWGCLFPATSNPKAAEVTAAKTPIDCYVAQSGSGTAGTWASFAGYDKKDATPIGCLKEEGGDTHDGDTAQTYSSTPPITGTVTNATVVGTSGAAASQIQMTVSSPWSTTPVAGQVITVSGDTGFGPSPDPVNGTWTVLSATSNTVTFSVYPGVPTGTWTGGDTIAISAAAPATTTSAATTDHYGLFENEMASTTSQDDEANAIYFFSYGKFTTTCPAGICPDTKVGTDQYITHLGKMVSANSTTAISPNKADIQGAGGGVYTTTTQEWPVNRFLFNVYNNTNATSTNGGPASGAALNFMGDYGFLCKASTAYDVDPNSPTGQTYRTEIENDITSQGFFPIDVSGTPFNEGAYTTTPDDPAPITGDTYFNEVDPTAGNTLTGTSTPTATNPVPSGLTSTPSNPVGFCLSFSG